MENIIETPAENYENAENGFDNIYGNTYDIISKVAYLSGVPYNIFENQYEPPDLAVYNVLEQNKAARIVRHLCILRNAIERRFGEIKKRMKFERKSIFAFPDLIPQESIEQLNQDGIRVWKNSIVQPYDLLIELNRLITDRINNCKSLFPVWLNWEYLRNIFIMPNGLSESGLRKSGTLYAENLSAYPYCVYLNINPDFKGNLFYHDKRFVCLLYKWHNDEFSDFSKVSDATGSVKASIYDFIDEAEKVVMVVDCENSDPYGLCATLKCLGSDVRSKIRKIILIDDVHTDNIWWILEQHTDIPIEHFMAERVKQSKSVADIELTARTCREHYKNNVDSFIIVSSDSDYYSLIYSLEDARFLLMAEHGKFSFDMKTVLDRKNIFFCYIDDFYDGDLEFLKKTVLFKEIYRAIGAEVHLNMREILSKSLQMTHIDMTPAEEKQFYDKHVRQMRLVLDDGGNVSFELKAN